MRKNHKLVRAIAAVTPALPAIALAALSGTASGVLNIYEPFNYATGALQGNTLDGTAGGFNAGTAQGQHWGRAGVGNPPPGINVTSPTLTGPTELPAALGNALSITHVSTGDGATNRMPLGQNYTSGVGNPAVFYSFLLNVSDLTNLAAASNPSVGAFFFSLNNTQTNNEQTGNPVVQPGKLQVRLDETDPTKFNLAIFGNESATSTSTAWATNQLDTNQTYFIVGSLNLNTSGGVNGAYRETRLWIDPDPVTFGLSAAPAYTANNTSTTTWSGNNVGSVLVRQHGWLPDLTMDELRVGGSWADVTPTLSAFFDANGAATGSGITAGGSYTWDAATTNWNLASDGVGSTQAWLGQSYKAVFAAGADASGAYSVTVSGTQNVTSLSFEKDAGVTDSNNNVTTPYPMPTLTGGTINLSTGLILADAGVTATIESTIAGSSGVIKSGGGTVILSGPLNYTGDTTINAGTLQIGNGGTTAALPTSSVITNNGTLVFNIGSSALTQGVDFNGDGISGAGGLTQAGTGTTLTLNVANTFTGITKATAGTILVTDSLGLQNSTVDTSGAGSIVFDNALTSISVGGLEGANSFSANSAASITVGNDVRAATYSANLGGSGSLTKVGTNSQTLDGENSYSGGTTINAGILHFTKTLAMPNTGAVTVNSGGTLSVRAGASGEWNDSTNTATVGSLGSLIAGRGGQGTADQIVWKDGSVLGISTLNAPGGSMTYSGVIGGFRTDTGTTNTVGLLKRGLGTLALTGNSTFSGPLSVENNGGIIALTTALSNAGQSMTIPTVSIGNAGGDNTITDGSRDAGVKILADNALPTNSLISFGSSVNGLDAPSSLLQLHDGFAATGSLPAGPSYNQTVRGFTGSSGRVKLGLGTLTVDVPEGESYAYSGTLRGEYDSVAAHANVIKTGLGRQDWNQSNGSFHGDFILQQGTVGIGHGQVFGPSGGTNRLIINGGTLMNTSGGSMSMVVPKVEIAGSFAFDVNGSSNAQFLNSVVTLTTANPTITVIPAQSGISGQFIIFAKLTDNGQGYGFTKAGAGTLNLTPSGIAGANDYSGATTILDGALRVVEFSQIGNGSSDVNLSGGQLEYNGAGASNFRHFTLTNPIHVTADSTIAYNSTTASLTDVTDPIGIVFEFDNSTFDHTGGTLTFEHKGSSQGITYRPRFSASGFDYAGPVVISNGGGTRKTVLESTNATGTQTWAGNITGDGSYSRGTGGNTLFAGQLVSVGGISIADNSKIQLANSAGNDRVIKTGSLTIGATSSQLDLTNNKLITTAVSAGTWNGSAYDGLSGMVQSGMGTINLGQPAWDGSGVITSDTSATTGIVTTIAVASAGDVGKTSFGGQSVNPSDALAMFTYNGDANLSGNVDADDYFAIDSNYNKSGTVFGFDNGDFNYDGVIDGDDYVLIDAGFTGQGAPISAAAGVAGVAAVPEPGALSLLALAAAPLLRRRRSA